MADNERIHVRGLENLQPDAVKVVDLSNLRVSGSKGVGLVRDSLREAIQNELVRDRLAEFENGSNGIDVHAKGSGHVKAVQADREEFTTNPIN
jgi:hypothetical protein